MTFRDESFYMWDQSTMIQYFYHVIKPNTSKSLEVDEIRDDGRNNETVRMKQSWPCGSKISKQSRLFINICTGTHNRVFKEVNLTVRRSDNQHQHVLLKIPDLCLSLGTKFPKKKLLLRRL